MEKSTIEQTIQDKGFYIATVVGDSMMPMLHNKKDLVRIEPAKSILKKYDVPLYKRPTGEYVLHRIIDVKKDCYIICGDNRFHKERVPFDWVVGVLVSFERNGKTYDITNQEYLKYIANIRKSFWHRKIKHKMRKIRNQLIQKNRKL